MNQPQLDPPYLDYQRRRRAHWDATARLLAQQKRSWGNYYHRRLAEIYQGVIPPGASVLEIGCGEGDLLAAVHPSFGLGIDFSGEMLRRAKTKHPGLHFCLGDAHEGFLHGKKFDFIILSDLLNDAWDVQTVFANAAEMCHPGTRIILNTYSRLWEPPLLSAEKLQLARPVLYQNWLTVEDARILMRYGGFEIVRSWQEILAPLSIPLFTAVANRYLARLAPLNQLCLSNFIIARPYPSPQRKDNPSVSIIVPARNEAGNIGRIFAELPDLGVETELIFVEGNSRDDTYAVIERSIAEHPEVCARLYRQVGAGKGDAVRLGFERASGDILMILDADLTVPAGTLPRFYAAISSGQGEFINGVRLVYPMGKQSMRFMNLVGNKLFSMMFSWLIDQPIKDTLCGTKVLWREDYQRIARNRAYFGDFDPFGDFDLLFGAARLGLKIIDMPVRYFDRTYGTTNIHRWRNGAQLLRMVIFGARRLKFK